MPKPLTPRDLLIEEIKDLYSTEILLTKMLPRMIRAAYHTELKNTFLRNLEDTRVHARRTEEMLAKLGVKSRSKKCRLVEGMIEEARQVINGDAPAVIKDLALIAAAQKIEHHEIAGYGCARTLADLIGESELADTLQETLDEEGAADKSLTEVAMGLNIETVACS